MKKLIQIFKNRRVYLILGSVTSFAIALSKTYETPENAALVGIWILLGVILLIDPKRINALNFAGNSVKLQEAANELKAISKTTAAVLLEGIQSGGRWGGGLDIERKEHLRNEIVEALKNSGFEDDEIGRMFIPWNQWVLFDYGHRIVSHAQQDFMRNQALHPAENQTRVNFQQMTTDFGQIHSINAPARALAIRELLERYQLLSPEITQFIEDMKSYEETGQHTNFARFKGLMENNQ